MNRGTSRHSTLHTYTVADGRIVALMVFGLMFFLGGCAPSNEKGVVVVYTALDQIFSEEILQTFEQRTGIKIKAVYDTEATKTVGMVNRILAEQAHPQCDVFWNNEIVRTVMLKRRGLLALYASPSANDIPEEIKDAAGYWHGFAARARILICNTDLLSNKDRSVSILDLTGPKWNGKVSLAYPLFGTTATHAAALFAYWGDEKAKAYYQALKANGVVIADGNATSKDMVARGEVAVGFTDTDDANVALQQGKPVEIIFPDQGEEQMGTLVIPNTVALIKDCPHPEAGKKLIDFLLSREVEAMLAKSGSAQMPVRAEVPVPDGNTSLSGVKAMKVDWNDVEAKLIYVSHFMEELFVR